MRKLLFGLFAICGSLSLCAQAPLLERRISLSIDNDRLDVALKRISSAGSFNFSYNPEILDEGKLVKYAFVNKSIREVLDEVFKGAVEYKARGKYLILTRARQTTQEPAILTGYIVDEATGERLKDVSIYDPVTLTSTITDSFGYFEIKIDKPSPDLMLSVNRANYSDTLVYVQSRDRLLNIPIKINKEKVAVIADSLGQKVKRFWEKQVLFFENNKNLRNIDDTLYRKTQVSFVPFVGTNHKMSGHVINDYSLNIVGGYALGVRRLEVGGLFNLVRGDMTGVQFAGLLNGIGGRMSGVQFAGVFNGNRYASRGIQFAGVLNLNTDDTEGLQAGGVGNLTAGRQDGPQIAGVFNIAARDADAVQLAGVFNLAGKNIRGAQVAGVVNVSGKNVKGVQVAGVMNVAGKGIRGAQVAGVLNIASGVKGSQIGLVNIADSVQGVPIGLMSFVWKGYHKIEVSADEIFYTNVSFRTGVRQFYNIFTAGAKPSTYGDDETLWTFGYGLGTAPRLSRKLFLNLDLTSNQIIHGNKIDAINLLNKVYVGFDYQFLRKMSLTFGATVNGYITKNSVDSYPELFTEYQPDIFYDRDFGRSHNLKMWIGGKIGLRFL